MVDPLILVTTITTKLNSSTTMTTRSKAPVLQVAFCQPSGKRSGDPQCDALGFPGRRCWLILVGHMNWFAWLIMVKLMVDHDSFMMLMDAN